MRFFHDGSGIYFASPLLKKRQLSYSMKRFLIHISLFLFSLRIKLTEVEKHFSGALIL